MSSKSKSSLSEPSNNKASPATPRVSKLTRGVAKSDADSPSPLQNPRLSVDRSPRSINSKPTVDRRSPKIATPPEKQPTRVLKGSELQAQLSLLQEDVKKAKEKLVLVEKEKAHAIEELKEAQRLAEEANEKLREALVAQKRAEENSEIDKFRAVEMEQAGIEAAQKKEEEWQKELEAVRNQHALDVSALLSATQELQRVKQELAMTCDAKNQALGHADDATKIAEFNAEKVEVLSAELVRLKALLDSKLETEANENTRLVSELNSEIETLKRELEKVKSYEEKLQEKEASIEQLNIELEAAKMTESTARNLVEEWQMKVEDLEVQAEEANRLERSASESLESVMKQLEGSNDLLHDAKSEIASLKEKVGLLEMSFGRQRGDLEESERLLDMAKEEAADMARKLDFLKSELETVKEEKTQALNNEKLAAASVQTLLEEKNILINELETSRNEEEKSKQAMESLSAALHEVSSESREAKEKLLSSQAENENHVAQIEDLRLVLQAKNEKYAMMLDDAKHEIDALTNSIEQSKHEYQNSKAEWEQKELHFTNRVKQAEDENSSVEKEISRLINLLKEAEEEACSTKDEGAQLKNTLIEAESEIVYLKEVLGEAKAESMRLKESLMDKENELHSVIMENEELQTREAASFKKIEELTKLLEEAKAQKQAEENGELSDSEKDYDMLPKVVEFSEQNGDRREEKLKMDLPSQQCEQPVKENHEMEKNILCDEEVRTNTVKVETMNGNPKDNDRKEKEEEDSVEADFKMWESCKIGEKDFSPEREPEQESFEEDMDSKIEGVESYDQINGLSSAENLDNGGSSPSKQQQQQKKKKPLLRKFGSLLKKKGSSNQK
ncbi:LOW QUALITY PROTEIN: WEB family protein At3g02930, chloroplastic-like [Actinidia eriantha]|uniref:LOW QUALITY PROTEIN: WEB family protein At3g02930, chloroplastic-like n=1 Tax=Actinidia eriantha TaxID=165200 RepID=UPI00258BDEEF|nr:LOW QUALITY PROTEIN: WEB family protein At3g02930, chloroplastic-like [Actinidia eriantha]